MEGAGFLSYLKTIFSFNEAQPLLFTQFYFWAFFFVVFAGFSLLCNRRLMRNAFLFLVSLFFYFKTSGLFVLILIFSTFYNFFAAKGIAASRKQWGRRLWLYVGVCINLAVLFYFKYAYFFTDVYNNLFHTHFKVFNYLAYWANAFDVHHFSVDVILLPVGISFFTFQVLRLVRTQDNFIVIRLRRFFYSPAKGRHSRNGSRHTRTCKRRRHGTLLEQA